MLLPSCMPLVPVYQVDTVGRTWAARRTARGICSISNVRSITTDWDLCNVGGGVQSRSQQVSVRHL